MANASSSWSIRLVRSPKAVSSRRACHVPSAMPNVPSEPARRCAARVARSRRAGVGSLTAARMSPISSSMSPRWDRHSARNASRTDADELTRVQPNSSATRSCSVIGSNGLAIRPATSSSANCVRSEACTLAVRKITGTVPTTSSSRSRSSVAGPSRSGIMTSSRMPSGRSSRAWRSPSAPLGAVVTSQPATSSRLILATSLIPASSSMISTRLARSTCSSCACRGADRPLEHGQHPLLERLG